MRKIKLSDNTIDLVVKMSEGDDGAVRAIMEMLSDKTIDIDPDSVIMGGMMKVLALDNGSHIYILHNDIKRLYIK